MNNDEEGKSQSVEKVITCDSSSVRSSRMKFRVVLNDTTDYSIRDTSDQQDTNLSNEEKNDDSSVLTKNNNRRNSFDDAATEERIKEMQDVEDSSNFNDVTLSNTTQFDAIDNIQKPSSKRSESTENLLSIFLTTNESKPNTLENIQMLLNHESHHLCLLTTIQQYKYILQQSKVSDEIIWNIFYNISDLIYSQKSLVTYLESMITDLDSQPMHFDKIMDLYILLHVKCIDYVKNIPVASREIKSLFEKHLNFKSAIDEVIYEGKTTCLNALIAKPVNWLCNSLELIKNLIDTADGEHDKRKLEETLKNLKSSKDENKKSHKYITEVPNFLRSNLFVEQLPSDIRKLRHVFLFSGMVVCAKQKLQTECNHATRNLHADHEDKCSISKGLLEMKFIERFDVKWFISLKNLVFHLSKSVESNDRRKNDIAALKDKIRDLKLQLITEKSKLHSDIDSQISKISIKRSKSNNFSIRRIMIKKEVDKLCNQIFKIQTDLLLISPTTAFVISNGPERPHTLLLPSMKDLEVWKCEILKAQREQKLIDCSYMSLTAVNNLLDSFRRYSFIIEVATSPLLHDDGVSGVLITNIYKVDGLNPDFRYYLSIEVDSFNLNELKARTKLCFGASSLSWNESFDIDLDCSQCLNILLYEIKNYGGSKESLIGYFEFQLKSKDFLNQSITKTISMLSNESAKLTLEASFKFEAKNELMKRQPSMKNASLFGIHIKSVVSREKNKGNVIVKNVPVIIVACFKRIEDNGLDEEGIYRISGSKNEIYELYKKLNKNTFNAINNLHEYDLHTITGIVKMYLRELPEPLMMSENYERLLNISNIEDETERFKNYEEVIQKLPEPNHSTVIFVLKHFRKVCSHSNKNQMIASNLGLILGPTLIMPPCEPDKQGLNNSNIAFEIMHSMLLSRVLTHILHGVCTGNIVLQ